ncbi:hypothetical protein Taro_025244 [Colocasia esculenta]|uniref:HpcH/HpaI aldolase/citrate lyase domain-containing protein n=1 Tax=Colocasia esculenta TaxID=4460 RepID=A0A843VBQ2_COLES|nr:hypothetical protein [Colocasia esculenta]
MAASSLAACLPNAGRPGATSRPPPPASKALISVLPFRSRRSNPISAMSSSPLPPSHFPGRGRTTVSTPRAASAAATTVSPTLTLKSRITAGETLYGIFLLSASPTLAEIAGLAGYDYVVVDMEHGPGGISDALSCLRALAATGTPAILRLPESSAVWAKKALDLGPQGVMFPMVDDATAAAAAVSYCRYPPRGVRGAAHPVVRASGYGIDDGYLEHYEEELLIMCQVETQKGVREVEAIAAVDGVDCIQMGPLDLSACLGYLWDPGHRKVREVMAGIERRVLAKSGDGGAYLSGFAVPHDPPEELKKRGYHMVAGAVDLVMFRKAAVEDVLRFRNAPGSRDAAGSVEGAEGDEKERGYWSE